MDKIDYPAQFALYEALPEHDRRTFLEHLERETDWEFDPEEFLEIVVDRVCDSVTSITDLERLRSINSIWKEIAVLVNSISSQYEYDLMLPIRRIWITPSPNSVTIGATANGSAYKI